MTVPDERLARSLADLASVTLAELAENAALQTRVDRKYVLPLGAADQLVTALAPSARVLEIEENRSFGYRSVYFDTPGLDCYRLAAHRRSMRFKVRTRTYVDSEQCWLEVKTRDRRGRTVKHRQPHDAHATAHLPADALAFVGEVLASVGVPTRPLGLRPTLVTQYRRSTLYLPGDDSRLTLDTELLCRQDCAGSALLPDRAIVESKTTLHASAVDRLLWSAGYRPVRISKYGTGLAALNPDLPGTHWRPVLRRHPFLVARPDHLAGLTSQRRHSPLTDSAEPVARA